ncbi:MAG: GNAT family N-acetyltransferase [Nocardioides sp.]
MGELLLEPVADPAAHSEGLVQHLLHRRFLGEHVDADAARAAAVAMVARVIDRSELLMITHDGVDAGRAWTVVQGEDLSILWLSLDDAGLAGVVRTPLIERARAGGHARLTIGAAPGNPTDEAFVQGAGFDISAVQMRLDLAHELPSEPAVALVPMTDVDYERWEADEIDSYAEARERSGESRERALKISREQHAELLPDGLATEHHHFFVGQVEGQRVGTLWLGTERPMVFVYDVLVDEQHRRQGYGAGLMRAGALWAQGRGAPLLGLNVFGYNHGARALYDQLGYHVVESYLGLSLT